MCASLSAGCEARRGCCSSATPVRRAPLRAEEQLETRCRGWRERCTSRTAAGVSQRIDADREDAHVTTGGPEAPDGPSSRGDQREESVAMRSSGRRRTRAGRWAESGRRSPLWSAQPQSGGGRFGRPRTSRERSAARGRTSSFLTRDAEPHPAVDKRERRHERDPLPAPPRARRRAQQKAAGLGSELRPARHAEAARKTRGRGSDRTAAAGPGTPSARAARARQKERELASDLP